MRFALLRGTSAISKLIEWQTRGEFSHACLVFADGSVIESKEFIGVRLLSRLPHGFTQFEVKTSAMEERAIRYWAVSQIGKPYDYEGVLRFLTRHKASVSEKNKWFCSELVFAGFASIGRLLFRNTKAWEVSPDMLKRSTEAFKV